MVKAYQNSTQEPRVQILKSQAIYKSTPPRVASFSSRGPSVFISNIIKPDITAPGVEILAAYSPMAPPSGLFVDESSVKYNILSGTSMACPHVAAAAAFVKSFNPDWSPSAIKSALMTTAWVMDPSQSLDAEFAYGSGHIYPLKAKDPGLVYDTSGEDYRKIWCSICASCHTNLTPRQLNYPSMAAQVGGRFAFRVTFQRTVTNVGTANSRYVASIQGQRSKLHIRVDPNNLIFTALNQKRSFVVTVKGKGIKTLTTKSMSLIWSDGKHKVRSPLVVYTTSATSSAGGSTL